MLNKKIDMISEARTPNELFSIIEGQIDSLLDISHLSIFTYSQQGKAYIFRKRIVRVKDFDRLNSEEKLSLDDPIVTHLLDIKRAFLIKEISDNIAVALTKDRRSFLSFLTDRLLELNAILCVPGFESDKLVTIFMFGKKISREEYSIEEIELFSALVEQSAKVIYNFNLLKNDVDLFVKSVRKLKNELEGKDPYTKGHADRVAQFATIVGKKLKKELEKIPYGEISLYYAAELHDVGKINLPDSVLKKESNLNKEEYDEVKKHPLESVKIISPIEKFLGKTIIEGVLQHHENYDGSGYPYGKKGGEISLLARILMVADSFDAMISDRPYRDALVQYKAISELKAGKGIQFDPVVLDAFLEAYKEGLFKDIFYSEWEYKASD